MVGPSLVFEWHSSFFKVKFDFYSNKTQKAAIVNITSKWSTIAIFEGSTAGKGVNKRLIFLKQIKKRRYAIRRQRGRPVKEDADGDTGFSIHCNFSAIAVYQAAVVHQLAVVEA